MPFCSSCGSKHAGEVKFCTACGTRVPTPAAPTAPFDPAVVTHQAVAVHSLSPENLGVTQAPTEAPATAHTMFVPAPSTVAAPAEGAGPTPAHPAHLNLSLHDIGAPDQQPGQWSSLVSETQDRLPTPPDTYRTAPGYPASGAPTADLTGATAFAPSSSATDNTAMLRIAAMAAGGLVALFLVIKLIGAIADGGFGGVLVTVGLIALAGVGYAAWTSHNQETREARTLASLPPSVQHVVAQMEPGAQSSFFDEYERNKKRTWVAYLLLWPCFGTHYFYLRQPLLNVFYWFTGAGAGLWGLIDVFRMRSLVRAANEQVARQALQTLHIGATFASMPAAPAAMRAPVPPYTPQAPTPGI